MFWYWSLGVQIHCSFSGMLLPGPQAQLCGTHLRMPMIVAEDDQNPSSPYRLTVPNNTCREALKVEPWKRPAPCE